MFDFIIMLSRYLFVLYITAFLAFGFLYILDERGRHYLHGKTSVLMQRLIIVFLHLTAFVILSYNIGLYSFTMKNVAIGGMGLLFLFYAFFTTNIVYRQSCPLIWNGVLFLLDVSLIMLTRLNTVLAVKQLLWMFLSATLMLSIPFILKCVPRFERLEQGYIILGLILILSTIFLGREEYGSLNWIKIGKIGFQPSEIVKFLFIFYLASVFRKKVELRELIWTMGLSGMIVLLLAYQRDLGGALIFFVTYMVMLYIATSNEVLFLGGMGLASVAATFAYKLFAHVRVRVSVWQDPWRDIDSGGYQIVQSLFALCTWGFWGSGLGKGMPYKIPVVSKDFIFAAICEEFGGFFAFGILGIFIMLFLRGIIIALNCQRRYYSLIAAGIITMLEFQTFLIIGGVIKLIPLTGVTLPFISYGGTSIFVSILMVGILQWIYTYSERAEQGRARQKRKRGGGMG